ncbi:MAG: hypothetical protein ABFC96_10625 [Thermoguttaceae bacterium]
MRKTILVLLASVALLAAAMRSTAAEMKPVATVSVASYDKLMSSVGTLGQLAGNPNLARGIEGMLAMFTMGRGLTGVDKTQPWAVVVLSDGVQPVFRGSPEDYQKEMAAHLAQYVFIPAEAKQLAMTAKQFPPAANAIKVNDGVYEIQSGPKTIFAQQKGNWTVIAAEKVHLATAPADPVSLLGDLPKNYLVAVRISVKNLPPESRESFLKGFHQTIELGKAQRPGESDAEYAGRKLATTVGAECVTTMTNELEDLTLGLAVDQSTSNVHLDIEATAQSGTKLADQLATMKAATSQFNGLVAPGAAACGNRVGSLTDADVTRIKQALTIVQKSATADLANQGLSADEVKSATQMIGDVFDVFGRTADAKKIDAGVTAFLEPDAAAVVGGLAVADGAKLDKVLKQLVGELQQSDPDAAKQIKLNAETHEGVRFHTMSLPTPDESMKPLVGDTLEIVIGIADDKLLLAAGRDAAGKLKQAIKRSKAAAGKEAPPMHGSLSVGALARFVAANGKSDIDKKHAGMAAASLKEAGGKDHLLITVEPVDKGARLRIEAEEGLIKAVGAAAKNAPMGMPAGGPPGQMPGPGAMPPSP